MENKTSKRIKWLIAAVLLLFFTVAVLDEAPDFMVGFRAGQNAAFAEMTGDMRHQIAIIQPLDSEATSQTFSNGVEYQMFESDGMLMVPIEAGENPFWLSAVKFLLSLLCVAAALSFLVHVVLFAVGFPRRHIFDYRNIVSLRWIAGSLGAIALSVYASMLVDYLWLRSHVVLEGYRVTLSSPSAGIVVALILVVLTEILNLAGRLQTEQDLTI
jgi:hypothetical protein